MGANIETYASTGLTPATTYYYRVRAYNSGGNSGYSNTASATTLAQLAQPQVYIAIRIDGLPGSGTQADPYDGSTPDKFDALMSKLQAVPSPAIHLVGRGPFRTYATHTWFVRSGWVVSGDGMYSTTLQMAGSVAGIHGVYCISSDPNISSNYVTIQDLTVDCNWAELSQTADTGAGGEKNIETNAVVLFGSNNIIQRVRSINTYGTWANSHESFAISIRAPKFSNGTNNVIQFCRVELPNGNMGNPFAMTGNQSATPPRIITNSKVVSCTGVGQNTGLTNSFTGGGVNYGYVQNCTIDNNTFTDCYSVAYSDQGSADGVQITNNTLYRGWLGVGICSNVFPKENIVISGNYLQIQNRVPGGGRSASVNGLPSGPIT